MSFKPIFSMPTLESDNTIEARYNILFTKSLNKNVNKNIYLSSPGHNHASAAHTEVLIPLEGQPSFLLASAPASLTQKMNPVRVDAEQEVEKVFSVNKHVVICSHKPIGS